VGKRKRGRKSLHNTGRVYSYFRPGRDEERKIYVRIEKEKGIKGEVKTKKKNGCFYFPPQMSAYNACTDERGRIEWDLERKA